DGSCEEKHQERDRIVLTSSCDGSSCACSPDHTEDRSEREERVKVVLLFISIAAFVVGLIANYAYNAATVSIVFMIAAWLLAGYEVMISAVKKFFSGFLMDEEFLMTVATVGAVALGEYPEAALVMILYQIGQRLEHFAVGKSQQSITDLLDIAAPYANLVTEEGVKRIDPADIEVGAILEIHPGELIPTDGVIISGLSSLNTAAITGESLPLEAGEGSRVLSGSVNGDGLLRMRAETIYAESTASRVMDMVEEASARKAPTETLVRRFSKIYTPVVVLLAILISIAPPLLFDQSFSTWIYRGLTFLVVSCPCAFVISVPLSFVSGIGMASRHGVLIRGGTDLEKLSKLKTLAFDKTGTLTEGKFSVIASHAELDVDEEKFIGLTATLEQSFTHPIAQSIVLYAEARGLKISSEGVSDILALPGHGVRGVINEANGLSLPVKLPATVYLGNAALMKMLGLHESAVADGCEGQAWTMSHVAIVPNFRDTRTYEEMHSGLPAEDIRYLGHIVIRDELKAEAAGTISSLREEGVERIALLTGDNEVFAREVAEEAGITEVHASLLPQDKVSWMEAAKAEEQNGTTGFTGDGINDAPVLMTADVGVAMGGLGSDAAIEAADVVLMQDNLSALLKGLIISKKTMSIARQNIIFALGVKFLFLLLATIGYMPMWLAVFADVGVTLLVILNCFRIFRISRLREIEEHHGNTVLAQE
ncbi:MAG: heavy metal translocating P-type ATPase, partial [Eubacteriales bacterium]|nr:heavy metal translocating P-type ATPase [Eubacteriales bacterium]